MADKKTSEQTVQKKVSIPAVKKQVVEDLQEDEVSVNDPQIPAAIQARVPNRGRLSAFNVLVGKEVIFVGSREEALRVASTYNTIHGLGSSVREIIF